MINSISSTQNIYSVQPTQNNPANIPIEEKMTGQATGLEQGSENAQDAISLLDTAEGSLDSVLQSLQDIRQLSVQANSGIMTDSDKGFIQDQIDDLLEGINDTLANTEFNTIKVLEGGFEGNVQTGANEGQGQMMRVENVSLEAIGMDGYSVLNGGNMDQLDSAIEQVTSARASIGAQTNGLDSAIRSNDIARENTLASRSNLEEDFVSQIMKVKQADYVKQYQIQMQKINMDSEKEKLSVLG